MDRHLRGRAGPRLRNPQAPPPKKTNEGNELKPRQHDDTQKHPPPLPLALPQHSSNMSAEKAKAVSKDLVTKSTTAARVAAQSGPAAATLEARKQKKKQRGTTPPPPQRGKPKLNPPLYSE